MIGFNLYSSPEMFRATERLIKERKNNGEHICLSKSMFLLDELFLMMDLPVKDYINNYVYAKKRYAEAILHELGVETNKLAPYGKDGIGIRGELDYRGERDATKGNKHDKDSSLSH